MLSKKPIVSVVIRTKNEEKFIGLVLDLLYRQTFKEFEVVIVDSGSSDKTLEIVKRYPVKILKISPKDFTYGLSLNLGIENSKGKYICIMSGHSIPISDTWLSDGVSVLEEKDVAAVSSYYSEFILGYFSRLIGRISLIALKHRLDYTPWITNTNSLIKKRLWEEYHFDEKLEGSEDYDWGKEMIARGYNVVKYKPFSVFHSHRLLGKPTYHDMLPIWGKWNEIVDRKKRPSK